MTRFEKIKAMTVEEMAKAIDTIAKLTGDICKEIGDCPWMDDDGNYSENGNCVPCIVKWLESEVMDTTVLCNEECGIRNEGLKPCPFCGANAIDIETSYFHNGSGKCTPMYSAVCKACYCETKDFNTELEAVKAWNRRET